MLTHLTDRGCRSVKPRSSLQRQRIPRLLSWSQSLLGRLPGAQDRAQHRSILMVAHLVWVVRVVLGHIHGTHPTIQRCLLLLKLLECLSSLSNCNINANDICHRKPCHGR